MLCRRNARADRCSLFSFLSRSLLQRAERRVLKPCYPDRASVGLLRRTQTRRARRRKTGWRRDVGAMETGVIELLETVLLASDLDEKDSSEPEQSGRKAGETLRMKGNADRTSLALVLPYPLFDSDEARLPFSPAGLKATERPCHTIARDPRSLPLPSLAPSHSYRTRATPTCALTTDFPPNLPRCHPTHPATSTTQFLSPRSPTTHTLSSRRPSQRSRSSTRRSPTRLLAQPRMSFPPPPLKLGNPLHPPSLPPHHQTDDSSTTNNPFGPLLFLLQTLLPSSRLNGPLPDRASGCCSSTAPAASSLSPSLPSSSR
jgi:hypothetical protein